MGLIKKIFIDIFKYDFILIVISNQYYKLQSGILKVFLAVSKSESCSKIISKLYEGFREAVPR